MSPFNSLAVNPSKLPDTSPTVKLSKYQTISLRKTLTLAPTSAPSNTPIDAPSSVPSKMPTSIPKPLPLPLPQSEADPMFSIPVCMQRLDTDRNSAMNKILTIFEADAEKLGPFFAEAKLQE